MRDRYLKEVRMELKCKRQGEIVPSRWKYRQIMNFIAPFTGSRSGVADNCGNDDDHDHDQTCSADGETTPSEAVKAPQSTIKVPVSQPDIKSQVAFVPQLQSVAQDTEMTPLAVMTKVSSSPQSNSNSKAGRKRRSIQESASPPPSQRTQSPTKWLAKDNGTSPPTRPRDEDELFLLSFVPALKRLAPQKRCETKIKIQQIMYEAEFNVAQPELKDKQSEPETQD